MDLIKDDLETEFLLDTVELLQTPICEEENDTGVLDLPIDDCLFDDDALEDFVAGIDFDFANDPITFDSDILSPSPGLSTLPDCNHESSDESYLLEPAFGDAKPECDSTIGFSKSSRPTVDKAGASQKTTVQTLESKTDQTKSLDQRFTKPAKFRRCDSTSGSISSTSSTTMTSPCSEYSNSISFNKPTADTMPVRTPVRKIVASTTPEDKKQTDKLDTTGMTPAQIRRAKREKKMARNRELAAQSRLRRKKMYAQLEQENKELREKLAAYESGLIQPKRETLPISSGDTHSRTRTRKRPASSLVQGGKVGTAAFAVALSVVAFVDTGSIGADRHAQFLNTQLLASWAIALDLLEGDSEKIKQAAEAVVGAQSYYYMDLLLMLMVCLLFAMGVFALSLYVFNTLDKRATKKYRTRHTKASIRRLNVDRKSHGQYPDRQAQYPDRQAQYPDRQAQYPDRQATSLSRIVQF